MSKAAHRSPPRQCVPSDENVKRASQQITHLPDRDVLSLDHSVAGPYSSGDDGLNPIHHAAYLHMALKSYNGNWTDLRTMFPGAIEVDYHRDASSPDGLSYNDRMAQTRSGAIELLHQAWEHGAPAVMFRHGRSTSRRGATTHRSQIRAAMRSKEATPFLLRSQCVQHDSVFVAVIRPRPDRIARSLTEVLV
jgi:hypothetical protein